MWEELKDWGGWIVAVIGTITGGLVGNASAFNSRVQGLATMVQQLQSEIERLNAEVDKLRKENQALREEIKSLRK